MNRLEKKYKIDSFELILNKLNELGITPNKKAESYHYYAPGKDNDVVKLVVVGNKVEIYRLLELNGKFSLIEKQPVKNAKAGLEKFKLYGYNRLDLVIMENTDYQFEDGVVGLYTLNHSIQSVILSFPEGSHEAAEKAFGLLTAEQAGFRVEEFSETKAISECKEVDPGYYERFKEFPQWAVFVGRKIQ